MELARATCVWTLLFLILLVATLAASGFAQATLPPQDEASPPTPKGIEEEDPTKPVAFSIRDEYRNSKDGAWSNTAIFRIDRLVLKNFGIKGGGKGLILRFDAPFNAVHRGAITKNGLGDLYFQGLYIPRVGLKRLVAVGTGIVFPTATSDILGRGKLILAPTIIPVWYFSHRERLFVLRTQNYVSVAGKSGRPGVNYLLVAPTLVHKVSRRWWLSEDTEFKWDWHNKLASAITGLQIGRMIKRGFGFWVKPEVGWGRGRQSDFNLKFTAFRIR